jgi:hypothetical protein
MSTQTIYKQLISAGMSPAGACGLMGNMNAESAMRANNAQDGMTKLTDAEYTAQTDNGTYTNFVRDAVGYGLCQWTYWTRKQALLNFAKQKGVSIGDESMQVEFAIQELKTGYPGLWSYLCTTSDVNTAASRICKEYERPAINNIDVRASAGLRFLAELSGGTAPEPSKTPTPSTPDTEEVVEVNIPVLKNGAKGAPVEALQAILAGHGYDLGRTGVDGSFGPVTESAVRRYQSRNGLQTDGIVGPATWKKLLGV